MPRSVGDARTIADVLAELHCHWHPDADAHWFPDSWPHIVWHAHRNANVESHAFDFAESHPGANPPGDFDIDEHRPR